MEVKKKASYLLATSIVIVIGLTLVLILNLFYNASSIMIWGDILCYLTLLIVFPLIKQCKIISASNILIGGLLLSLIMQKLVADLYSEHEVHYLRMYETLSFLILFLLFWSLFALKQIQLVFYIVASLIVLSGHFYVHILRLPPETAIPVEIWRIYLTGIVVLITSGIIANLILNLSQGLIIMTEDRNRVIKMQKESLEEVVEERTEALKRSNNELKQFAYTTSHDLKEPLRMISGFMGLIQIHLQKNYPADPEIEEYLKYATDGAQRMTGLINALLSYSRINTHQSDLTNVDLNEVVRSAEAILKFPIEENQTVINTDPLPTISADKNQMVQLFQNLIDNGIKYRKADIPPQIDISCEMRPEEVEIIIKDNGIGINPEYHDRIFIIFHRLPNEREINGTGVGLTICKKIVERHGGQIWIDSQVGQGSAFHFILPK